MTYLVIREQGRYVFGGAGTDTDLYWESGSPIWNNDGDTIIVRTPDGALVLENTY